MHARAYLINLSKFRVGVKLIDIRIEILWIAGRSQLVPELMQLGPFLCELPHHIVFLFVQLSELHLIIAQEHLFVGGKGEFRILLGN